MGKGAGLGCQFLAGRARGKKGVECLSTVLAEKDWCRRRVRDNIRMRTKYRPLDLPRTCSIALSIC
jgi:hypothetical protein